MCYTTAKVYRINLNPNDMLSPTDCKNNAAICSCGFVKNGHWIRKLLDKKRVLASNESLAVFLILLGDL